MSALSLFKDVHDAEFRLNGSHIIVNKMILGVCQVYQDFRDGEVVIRAVWQNNPQGSSPDLRIPLRRLPLRAMYDCPHGYVRGAWFSRGPARTRFQGLVQGSLWGVGAGGEVESDFPISPLLAALIQQPKRFSGARKGSPRTNEIMVTPDDYVLYRGLYIGEYQGRHKIKLALSEIPPDVDTALRNAALSVCN